MMHETDNLALQSQLDRLVPLMRRELIYRPHAFGGKPCYVIEDPVSARFFRVGLAEHTFLSRLDGVRTIGQALCDTRAAHPECPFSCADAVAICQWVVRSGLAGDVSVERTSAPRAGAEARVSHARGSRISPLSLQVPLLHPDRFFERLTPWVAWCFSLYALPGWLLLVGWAIRDLMVHHQRLWSVSSGMLAADNWVWLAFSWLLLKIAHECGHAVVCKRYGGEVREAGVIFILLAPLAYVDVTSSWRIRSKWSRIAVAAAGMYVELFLAAVAALIWVRVGPGAWSQVCLSVMTAASVMTVLFNANPLMRFDGYYILSDLVELPNLYSSGQLYVRYLMRRYVLGMRGVAPPDTGARGALVRVYGIASWIWRNLVFFGLVLTAATLLEGAGIVLSILALMLWLTTRIERAIDLFRREPGERPQGLRCALFGLALTGITAAVLLYVPWPGCVTAPAIVHYAPETIVRAGSDGFVREVRACGGKTVEPGQILVVMSNPELVKEIAELELDLRKSRLEHRILLRNNEMAKHKRNPNSCVP
jgi:putative peptide zinc metalloprotease protein